MRELIGLALLTAAVLVATPTAHGQDKPPDYAAVMAKIDAILASQTKTAAQVDALTSRLAALESRVAAGERFASAKAGYVPPPATPPAGVAVGVPPTTAATPALYAGVSLQPGPGPGSSVATVQTGPTFTSARVTVRSGDTEWRTGPLGIFRWRVRSSGYSGCGGSDPTPDFSQYQQMPARIVTVSGGCANGQCPAQR